MVSTLIDLTHGTFGFDPNLTQQGLIKPKRLEQIGIRKDVLGMLPLLLLLLLLPLLLLLLLLHLLLVLLLLTLLWLVLLLLPMSLPSGLAVVGGAFSILTPSGNHPVSIRKLWQLDWHAWGQVARQERSKQNGTQTRNQQSLYNQRPARILRGPERSRKSGPRTIRAYI